MTPWGKRTAVNISVIMLSEHWANWSQQSQTQDFVKVLILAAKLVFTDASTLQRKDKTIVDGYYFAAARRTLTVGCFQQSPHRPHIFHTRTRKGETFIRDLLPMGHFSHYSLTSLG